MGPHSRTIPECLLVHNQISTTTTLCNVSVSPGFHQIMYCRNLSTHSVSFMGCAPRSVTCFGLHNGGFWKASNMFQVSSSAEATLGVIFWGSHRSLFAKQGPVPTWAIHPYKSNSQNHAESFIECTFRSPWLETSTLVSEEKAKNAPGFVNSHYHIAVRWWSCNP